ncbi:GMC family oxidoreductase [Sinorhizobium meliloti]|uniref:Dehydrogenase n=1 Tax=Rhizobium meliloti TaxID=382 RepID=A0A2J0YYS2_RHIML|nr:GMC family oxidoreductase N-terminal domain-containing protein [Sinorhizobium meliloti]PJR13387.1 dehydrogenase [Sinorhizobium meliloti]
MAVDRDRRGFDYVIVGGGTAGCVLANRLSVDRACRVILLESGGPDWNPLLSIPLGVGLLWSRRLYDWGYESEPQAALGGRRIEMMRGKVLGGSTAINAMSHVHGRPGDFDRWEKNGCTAWSYEDVAPYIRRSERWERSDDRRGRDGPVGVTLSTSDDPLFDAWLHAARSAGYPILEDYNLGGAEGFGRAQFAVRGGRRQSASRTYLARASARSNLDILTAATVHRIIIENGRARGVALVHQGREIEIRAERAVLLAAGAFNTPKLLMLSGIGDARMLLSYGIKPLLDQREVGRNLQDHPGVVVAYRRSDPGAFRAQMRFDRLATNMLRAHLTGTGPATVLPSGLHGFVKLSDSADVPDIQFMFRGAPRDAGPWFPGVRPAYPDGYAIRPVLLHPASRGSVTLASASPGAPPRIDPNIFGDPADTARLKEGVRIARELGASKALDAFREKEISPGPEVRTEAQIDAFMRRVVMTAHHPAGTCRMGGDEDAIVDPQLRVRGIDGLRIADASVMPDLVSGNINATVMMIAERCAALLENSEVAPREEARCAHS